MINEKEFRRSRSGRKEESIRSGEIWRTRGSEYSSINTGRSKNWLSKREVNKVRK